MGKELTAAPRQAGVQTACLKTTSLLHAPRLAACQGHLFQPQPRGQTRQVAPGGALAHPFFGRTTDCASDLS